MLNENTVVHPIQESNIQWTFLTDDSDESVHVCVDFSRFCVEFGNDFNIFIMKKKPGNE